MRYVVAPGRNVPFETRPGLFSASVTGFRNLDNLARGPDGTLWIAEDNAWSDIWVYDPRSKDANGDGYRDGVTLFASLKDKAGEASGIYFGPDPGTLYVNIQIREHPAFRDGQRQDPGHQPASARPIIAFQEGVFRGGPSRPGLT